jgi:phosphoserine phosphatase RsbU/P
LHRSMASGEQGCAPMLVFAKTRTGSRVPVEMTVAPLRGEGGEVIGGIEVFRDLAPLFRDLQRARTIQQHALAPEPFDDPRVDVATRFVPHDLVAGDFYRVARLADGCVALCVADVSGHGVAAALFCMQLRALWDDQASHGGMPENFVSEVNRHLSHTVGDEGYFASGFFGHYDPGRGCLRYVNAGHPAPWLLRVGGTVEVLDRRGAALGLFATASYRAVDVQLEPGDQLLAYTDGITGIIDRLGHAIGTEGLMAMFRAGRRESAGASLTSIEAQLLASCGKVRLPCDLTLLLLRRTG